MKCGECFHWYDEEGNGFGVCLFDGKEYHQDTECKHPGYLNPSLAQGDPCIPPGCAGCRHIGLRIPYASMWPCNSCRRANPNDYYEEV